MNDPEWQAMSTRWSGTAGALPDVRSRAAGQASRHRRATVSFVTLLAGGVLVDLWAALFEGADPVMCAALIVWGLGVAAAVLWIQRGARLRQTASPREAVAFLDQRFRIELRGAHLFRWAYVVGVVFTAIHYRELFDDDPRAKMVVRLFSLAVFAFAFSAPWWVRRFTGRQRAELDAWRKWLDAQEL